jgi:hypothetical protein
MYVSAKAVTNWQLASHIDISYSGGLSVARLLIRTYKRMERRPGSESSTADPIQTRVAFILPLNKGFPSHSSNLSSFYILLHLEKKWLYHSYVIQRLE